MGATVALPFTLIRLRLTSEQTQTATESLFNDKINAATDDLHAMRQRWDGTQNIWEDDIARRNAAIDRLEGLANERPDSAPRISRLLSVYVRELSREHPPIDPPDGATPEDLGDWAKNPKVQRSDMENAVQVLGRLRGILPETPDDITIDLTGANLQGFTLTKLDFQGANLFDVQMQGAHLIHVQMQGANLGFAEMQGADLFGAQMQGAILIGAQMDDHTDLTGATLQAAAVRSVDFSTVPQIKEFLDTMFGDGSVTLPPNTTRPPHWPRHRLGYVEFGPELHKWRDDPENYKPPVQQDNQTTKAPE